ncbi:MAG: ion transporter [Puniceicoccaceae bacterium]
MKLRNLVDESQTRSGKYFDWFIQFAIVVSILGITFETVPGLSPQVYRLLHWLEYACVAIFTIELLLRIGFSKLGFRYLFTFFGIIDLLAILPFYLSLGIDLRGLRAFRLLRIFRVLKLARYNNALLRYRRAFRRAREELILFGITAIIVIYLSSVGIYFFESTAQPDKFSSIPESFWWAVATLTTVGYGDVYPITTGGKIFTFFILSIGLAIVAVPSGIIAATLTEVRDEEPDRSQTHRREP